MDEYYVISRRDSSLLGCVLSVAGYTDWGKLAVRLLVATEGRQMLLGRLLECDPADVSPLPLPALEHLCGGGTVLLEDLDGTCVVVRFGGLA